MEPQNHTTDRSVLESELRALRLGLYGLGVTLMVLSICFSLYIKKQNNLLVYQIETQNRLLNQNEPVFESNRQKMGALVQDLRAFAQTHNDIVPILVNHNLVRVQPQPAAAPARPANPK